MAVVGIDLGGTKVALAIFEEDGRLLYPRSVALDAREGDDVGKLIVRELSSLLTESRDEVSAIGVSVPGIYYAGSQTVWAPNIPGWTSYPLGAAIEGLLEGRVPVFVDSDRACYVLGETWQGCAAGHRNVIFLAVGTGIGAGIMIEGRVLRGAGDAAGAIGWLALDRPYRPEYEACGCFEYHASGVGLSRVAGEMMAADSTYSGSLRDTDPACLTGKVILEANQSDDSLAQSVVSQAIQFWGMAVANLVSLFNPEIIVLGGGVFGLASRFLPEIRDEAEKWAQPISMGQVALQLSSLGANAGLYGAARLALTKM
jgi:glucokinase